MDRKAANLCAAFRPDLPAFKPFLSQYDPALRGPIVSQRSICADSIERVSHRDLAGRMKFLFVTNWHDCNAKLQQIYRARIARLRFVV